MTLTKILRDQGLADRATVHGFRSAFRDWCAETGKPLEIAEAALAHTVGGWTALNHIAIRLHEERRWWPAALADWDIAVRRGIRSKPSQPRGNKGQPHYAKDSRNVWITYAFSVLVSLGLGKMEGYYVIASGRDSTPPATAMWPVPSSP